MANIPDDDNSGSKYAEETIADHQGDGPHSYKSNNRLTASPDIDDDSTEIAPGHADFYEQHDVDELDSNLVAPLSHHVELTGMHQLSPPM